MTRQDLHAFVDEMPDDTPFELVVDELRKARVVAEIKAGLAEVARGETVIDLSWEKNLKNNLRGG